METFIRRLKHAAIAAVVIALLLGISWFSSALMTFAVMVITGATQVILVFLAFALIIVPIAAIFGAFDTNPKPKRKK